MPVGTSRPIEIMDAWMLALKKGEPKAASSFTNDDRHETFNGKKIASEIELDLSFTSPDWAPKVRHKSF